MPHVELSVKFLFNEVSGELPNERQARICALIADRPIVHHHCRRLTSRYQLANVPNIVSIWCVLSEPKLCERRLTRRTGLNLSVIPRC